MNKLKAALYIRVSTLHQIDKDSLPFQRQELINYAKYALNIEDVEIFEDAGYSAKNTERPQYQQMMQRIRKGEFTHLLVWKIDRISRNLKDFTEMYEELQSYNITFISKNEQFDTSSAMGEAMLKIILVFAELERKLTAERVFSIMLSRAQKGLWNGATVPLGYVWSEADKFPIISNSEAKTVQLIYNLYEKSRSTLKVAYYLNDNSIPTKRNGKWTAKTVRDVLRNPFYIGTYRYNMRESAGSRRYKKKEEWIVVEDNHPGIITEEQFNRVNQLLSDNYRGLTNIQRADIHTHLFSKLVYCGKCNELLTSGLDAARKDGYRPSRYSCVTSGGTKRCTNYVSDITLAPFIINYIANLLKLQRTITVSTSFKKIESILLKGSAFVDVVGIDDKALEETHFVLTSHLPENPYNKQTKNSQPPSNVATKELQQKKTKYEQALVRLEDLYLFDEDGISKKDYVFRKQAITKKLSAIEAAIKKAIKVNQQHVGRNFIDNAKYFLITKTLQQPRAINYRKLSDAVGRDVLSDFIHTIIKKVIVLDKRVQAITFTNGITHNFAHTPLIASKKPIRQKQHYTMYANAVLSYLQKNGATSRQTLQKELNMTRDSTYKVLHELIENGQVVRTGVSTSTIYRHKNSNL